MKEIFPSVYKEGKNIYTKNLVPGKRVYGEKLIKIGDKEFREWNPTRSKLSSSILNGLKELPIKESSKIIYLGASTGTTASHISDIIGYDGIIYAIEFAERVFRNLLELCKYRKNIAPIFADARKIEDYYWIEECDVVYVDIAQPDEVDIAIRNANKFLKENGFLMIAVKSQSIDVTKKPEEIYREERKKLEKAGFVVLQIINLEPYEQKHAMIIARKKNL
ncbi:MAG: fibrillarin-like rRNA/tRNA 2'-O-methyltransferase [Candidatus Aenigmatarchaeota archaeon]